MSFTSRTGPLPELLHNPQLLLIIVVRRQGLSWRPQAQSCTEPEWMEEMTRSALCHSCAGYLWYPFIK